MDPRTSSDSEHTGTLPIAGEGTLVVGGSSDSAEKTAPDWLAEARGSLDTPGKYIAYEDGDGHVVVAVQREWTRIGRSLAADIRFDDATVSRRHALIVNQADGTRVLDDRSLNGVFVNGRRVEWSPLSDGDQIAVGRHTLWFLDTSIVSGQPEAPAAPAAVSAD